MHFYLSGYEWETAGIFPHWRAPLGTRAQLDLRNLDQMAQAGGAPQGFGFFALPVQDSNLDHYLGDDLSKFVEQAGRTKVENVFGLSAGSITADSIGKILAQLYTELGDPEGISRFKPLLSREIYAGGKIWGAKRRRDNAIWWERWLNVRRMDYRRIKAEATDEHYRKVLDYWSKRYKVPYQDLLPPEAAGDTPLPHDTIIGDTFVEGSDTALTAHTATGPNGGHSWTHMAGSYTVIAASDDVDSASSNHNVGRADADLSSDDHFSKSDVTYTGATDGGVCTRIVSTATLTYYRFFAFIAVGDSRLEKRIAGTFTLINDYEDGLGEPTATEYKLESDGSSHTPSVAGSPLAAQTDTSITGNLRCGMTGFQGNTITFDNFEAADLAVAAIRRYSLPLTGVG